MEKVSAFGGKIPKFTFSGRTGWEGNLELKTAKIMKEYWEKKKVKPNPPPPLVHTFPPKDVQTSTKDVQF